MSKRRMAAQWASYLERVLPVNAPPVQKRETQRAFYAGAAALFGVIMRELEPGEEPTEADLRAMDEIAAELKEFGQTAGKP